MKPKGGPIISPDDPYNRALLRNVHPSGWVNPAPSGRYSLVVIGAGTAGLVTAAIAAALGAKVALIERHLMGGDCLNVGCVPSKGVIQASRIWAAIRNGGVFGATIGEGSQFDFGAAMGRMRRLRARISKADSAHRYKEMGIDLFIGEGRFTGLDSVEVEGKRLIFRRGAICAGARPAVPLIPGLEEAGYLTNETVFNLTELPRRMAVIGAGPVGCELAQAFRRFGAEVVLFELGERILPEEEPEASRIVQERIEKEGVRFVFRSKGLQVERRGGEKLLRLETGEWAVDEILVGSGRRPNVEGLNLEAANVAYDAKRGVAVNSRLQTANRRIFAAGDICFPYRFTHAADALAQIVVQNALFPHPFGLGYASTESLVIPSCVYTQPELAHVGIRAAEAREKGLELETLTFPMNEVDRAILDGEEEGFVRIHVRKGTETILGATVVAAHAGELISQFSLAMKSGLGVGAICRTIYPYPTQGEAIKKAANIWRKGRLTEGKKKLLRRWFSWTGS